MRMRQDHAARPREQREVEIGIEAARGSIAACFLKVIGTVGIIFLSDPDQQVENGLSLFIERRFAGGKCALPELGLIHKIETLRDWQRRIEEELL
jgi:hypothetical protein